MRVRILEIEGCEGAPVAAERLHRALDDLGLPDPGIERVVVDRDERADQSGFAGSPTILVDGRDLLPGAQPTRERVCRVYPGAAGPSGAPEVSDLRTALRDRVAERRPRAS